MKNLMIVSIVDDTNAVPVLVHCQHGAFRDRLRARGVKFVLSADAHAANAIDCAFGRVGDCEVLLPSPFAPERVLNACA